MFAEITGRHRSGLIDVKGDLISLKTGARDLFALRPGVRVALECGLLVEIDHVVERVVEYLLVHI